MDLLFNYNNQQVSKCEIESNIGAKFVVYQIKTLFL